jgi:hypothetical protein
MLNPRAPGFSGLFFIICGLAATTACGEDPDDYRPQPGPPAPPTVRATLQINWTIDGTRDPALCERISAVAFDSVISSRGFFVTEILAPCPDFETRVSLWVDRFVVRAALVDATERPATGRIVEDVVTLVPDQITVLTMDFPSSATMLLADGGVGTDAGAEPDAAGLPGATDAGVPDAGSDAGLDAGVPPGS